MPRILAFKIPQARPVEPFPEIHFCHDHRAPVFGLDEDAALAHVRRPESSVMPAGRLEERARDQDVARVSNGMQSWYESDLQQWHEKTLEALIATPKGEQPYQKMAEEFKERCRKSDRFPHR